MIGSSDTLPDFRTLDFAELMQRPTFLDFQFSSSIFLCICHYQAVQPLHFPPSGNVSRHIFLTWPFPHRHRHARWPVDIVELLHRFCCWALIWIMRHWAWLRRGYWRYRNLVDWLMIDSECVRAGLDHHQNPDHPIDAPTFCFLHDPTNHKNEEEGGMKASLTHTCPHLNIFWELSLPKTW